MTTHSITERDAISRWDKNPSKFKEKLSLTFLLPKLENTRGNSQRELLHQDSMVKLSLAVRSTGSEASFSPRCTMLKMIEVKFNLFQGRFRDVLFRVEHIAYRRRTLEVEFTHDLILSRFIR